MTNPDRLEKALPDLLRRSGWTGPVAETPPAVPLEEQKRWEQLFEEPAEPVRRRFPLGVLGASGLVAAALIVAVSFRSVLQSSQLKTVPSTTATRKSLDKSFTASQPKAQKKIKPDNFSIAEKPLPKQPSLSARPTVETETRGILKPKIAPEPDTTAQSDREAKFKQPTSPAQSDEDTLAKRRADTQDNLITSKKETRKQAATRFENKQDNAPSETIGEAPVIGKGQDKAALPVPAPAASSGTISQPSSSAFLVSATGLNSTARDSLQQQLARVHIQTGTIGEAVFDLKVQDGRISEIALVESSSSLKDSAAIETLRQTLQGVKLPASTNIATRVTVRVE